MPNDTEKPRRRGAVAVGALVGPVIAPLTAKRGFATADLIAAWPEIVGAAWADITAPERIAWPRGGSEEAEPGVLHLRVDGPRAILVQHELPQILERINAFFGYRAVGSVRLLQGPVATRKAPAPLAAAALAPETEAVLKEQLSAVEDDRLKAALDRLGRGVFRDRRE
jgi:hypothetical protein